MKPSFVNPYKAHEKQGIPTTRFQSRIDTADHQFLSGLRLTPGTFETTINTFVVKLISELKARGITDITHRAEFEHFITNFELTCPSYESTTESKSSKPTRRPRKPRVSGTPPGGTNPEAAPQWTLPQRLW